MGDIEEEVPYKNLPAGFNELDFYYYNADQPNGRNFFGKPEEVEPIDPAYHEYGNIEEKEIPYETKLLESVPFAVSDKKCVDYKKDAGKLRANIKASLDKYFEKEQKDMDLSKQTIFSLLNSRIVLTDNDNNEYKYAKILPANADTNDKTTYNTKRSQLNGGVEIHMEIDQPIYRVTKDVNGSEWYHTITNNANQKRTKCKYDSTNNSLIQTSCVEENSPTGNEENADKLVNKISKMDVNMYPDYRNINGVNPMPIYDPYKDKDDDSLVNIIMEYYKTLCDNKDKATNYMEKVNANDTTDALYAEMRRRYYREYANVLNMALGICVAASFVYSLTKI